MPHAELKYSTDLDIDAGEILTQVEAMILRHDAGSGDCKGRAYPAAASHHRHVILEVSLLAKPHRDAGFVAALKSDLAAMLAGHLPRPCWVSVNLSFSGPCYHTELLT